MKWEEVRELYPNQFVLLKDLKSHIENDKKIIDEVALIRTIEDKEVSKLLVKCKGDIFVFHTAKEELVIQRVENWLRYEKLNML